jgi:lysophospholipid acyltransferase 1/2
MALCYFCFGNQIFHIIISAGLSYIVIRSTKSNAMPWLVLLVTMCYLSFLHIKRQFFDKSSYALDITGPLMVLTQKVTSLAFSIRDGEEAKKTDNAGSRPPTDLQKKYTVSEIPDTVTFCGFVFQFQSMLAGPLVLYSDFTEFIQTQDTPNPIGIVIRKFTASMVFAFLFLKFGPTFDVQIVRDKDFYDGASYVYQMFYLTVGTTLERCKYYHAWILADAVCNASGLGYDKVKNTWDLVSNVDAVGFELGLNLKESLDLWNMGTMKWLRHVVYERSPPSIRTSLVYVVSAIWHGFYPGYYITFFSGALFTYAARTIRRSVRPLFIGSTGPKMFYHFLTWLTTRLAVAYATFSFVVQDFYPCWNMYIRLYFSIHILAVLAMFVVPPLFKPFNKSSVRPSSSTSVTSNGGTGTTTPVTPAAVTQSEFSVVRNGTVRKLVNNLANDGKSKSLNHMTMNGSGTAHNLKSNKEDHRFNFQSFEESQNKVNEDDWKNLVISTGMHGTGTAKLKTG